MLLRAPIILCVIPTDVINRIYKFFEEIFTSPNKSPTQAGILLRNAREHRKDVELLRTREKIA
jgi:hypothetical protein